MAYIDGEIIRAEESRPDWQDPTDYGDSNIAPGHIANRADEIDALAAALARGIRIEDLVEIPEHEERRYPPNN